MPDTITTAMILAAGRGERLRPLTDTTPKPLLEVAGKKLIEYHLENLAAAGITDIVINTSWLGQQIQQTLGDGSRYAVNIRYSDEADALETAGGIIKALPLLGDTFLVVNGDIWCDFDFSSWADRSLAQQAHLLLVNNPEHNIDGDFALQDDILLDTGGPMYTYSGIGIYTADFFNGTARGKYALAPLIREKNQQRLVTAQIYDGNWTDVGTVERLQQLEESLA